MSLVKGSEYKFNKVDAFAQFHIVRRLAPLFSELMAVLANSGLTDSGKKVEEINMEDIDFDKVAKSIGPVMTALSKIPDEDLNYSIHGLLKGVERKQPGGGWAPVMAPNSKDLIMFEDIKMDLILMITLAGKSFQANLGGFINALPSGLKEGAQQSQQIG